MRPTSSSSKKRLLSFLYLSWISRLSLDLDEPEAAGAVVEGGAVAVDEEPITMSLSLFGGMALGLGAGGDDEGGG